MKHLLSMYSKVQSPKLKKRIRSLVLKCIAREVQQISRDYGTQINLLVQNQDGGRIRESYTHQSVSLQNIQSEITRNRSEDLDTDDTDDECQNGGSAANGIGPFDLTSNLIDRQELRIGSRNLKTLDLRSKKIRKSSSDTVKLTTDTCSRKLQ